MDDQAKLERTLKFILMLHCRYGRSINELSTKLGITDRTVYRYLETIKRAGYIVECKKDGGITYYNINKEESVYHDIGDLLHFSEEEAYILSKAIHSIDNENVFKQNLIKKLYSLYDNDRVATPIIKKEYSDTIHKLTKAINNKEQVILEKYKSSNSSQIRNRLVEPFGYTTNFVAVWCFDVEAKSNKLFKTSRINTVQETGKKWQHEASHEKGHIDIFRISSYQKIPVKIKLSLRAFNLLLEEYPLAEKYIIKHTDNEYLLDTDVASLHGIGRFVMGLPEETEIIQPQELKDFIIDKIKKINY